jgi:hypothetical protein
VDEEIDFERGCQNQQRYDCDSAVCGAGDYDDGQGAPRHQSAQNCIKSQRAALANGRAQRFVFGVSKVTHVSLPWISNDILPIFSPLGIFFACSLSWLC